MDSKATWIQMPQRSNSKMKDAQGHLTLEPSGTLKLSILRKRADKRLVFESDVEEGTALAGNIAATTVKQTAVV